MPVGDYKSWLDAVEQILRTRRPDIRPSDLDPNAAYGAYSSGMMPVDFVSQPVVPLKGQGGAAPANVQVTITQRPGFGPDRVVGTLGIIAFAFAIAVLLFALRQDVSAAVTSYAITFSIVDAIAVGICVGIVKSNRWALILGCVWGVGRIVHAFFEGGLSESCFGSLYGVPILIYCGLRLLGVLGPKP